jgi:ribonuclease HI
MYERIYAYIDGASKGNPGKAAIGIVIKDCYGNTVERYKATIGEATNNTAEYTALKAALNLASRYSNNITIMSDSMLLVNQMNGVYKAKRDHIKRLINEINDIVKGKGLIVEYRLVRRESNKEADALANEALHEEQI